MKSDPLYSIADAARYLGLHSEQVRWYATSGKLETLKTAGGVRLLTLATLTAFAKSPLYLAAKKRNDAATAKVKARTDRK